MNFSRMWLLTVSTFFMLVGNAIFEEESIIMLTAYKDLLKIEKPALVLFVDKLDGITEKSLKELELALKVSVKQEQKNPSSMLTEHLNTVTLYCLAQRLTSEEVLESQVLRYPLLRYYDDPGSKSSARSINYDGRLLSKFISNFLKRQLSQKERRVSAQLKDLPHLGTLMSLNDPVVLYCGPNLPEYRSIFETFESVAKSGRHLFYHSLTSNICTQVNLMRVDLIRNLSYAEMEDHILTPEEKQTWVKVRQDELTNKLAKGQIQYQKYRDEFSSLVAPDTEFKRVDKFNSTLWDLYAVTRPVVFVANKAASLFEVFEATTNKTELLAKISAASKSNYFSDLEKAHDMVLIDEQEKYFGRHWFVLMKSPGDDLFDKIDVCAHMKTIAGTLKQTAPHVTVGCFNRSGATHKFGLEYADPNPEGFTLYYWQAYHPLHTVKEAEVEYLEAQAKYDQHGQNMRKSPYKFKREISAEDLPKLSDIAESFLSQIQKGTEPLYYYSEDETKHSRQVVGTQITYVTGKSLQSWFDAIPQNKTVYLLLTSGDVSKLEKQLTELSNSLFGSWGDSFELGYTNTASNELSRQLGKIGEGTSLWVWTDDSVRSLSSPTARVLGVNTLNSLKQALIAQKPVQDHTDL